MGRTKREVGREKKKKDRERLVSNKKNANDVWVSKFRGQVLW